MEYYTVKDIMTIMGVGRDKAYKIANMHDVPKIRIGRTIRIEKSGFDLWRANMLGKKI